jgi:hypothetical protein
MSPVRAAGCQTEEQPDKYGHMMVVVMVMMINQELATEYALSN